MKNLSHILLCLCCILFAAPLSGQTYDYTHEKFSEFIYTDERFEMKGRLFIPDNYDPEIDYPLVFVMHGSGRMGDDNISQLSDHACQFADTAHQTKHPCFVYVPQCPANMAYYWRGDNVSDACFYMLDSAIQKYSIDTTRMYITGNSAGAISVWWYCHDYPDIFAAAVPITNGKTVYADDETPFIDQMEHIPIWIIVGGIDPVYSITEEIWPLLDGYVNLGHYPVCTHAFRRISYDLSEEDIQLLIEEFNDLVYSEYLNADHGAVPRVIEAVREWMFAHQKHEKENIVLEQESPGEVISGERAFNYTVTDEVDSIAVYYIENRYPYSERWVLLKKLKAEPGAASYIFNSEAHEDFPFCRLRFLAMNSEGFPVGDDYSLDFTIDNEMNGKPYLHFIDDFFMHHPVLRTDSYTLKVFVEDPDSDNIDLDVFYSSDLGQSYAQIDQASAESGDTVEFTINMNELQEDLYKSIFKVEASDGDNTSSLETIYFRNLNGTPTDLEPIADDALVVTYPNPCTDYFYLNRRIEKGAILFMYNSVGQEVLYKKLLPGQDRIDISSLKNGMYIIVLETEDQISAQKLMKH